MGSFADVLRRWADDVEPDAPLYAAWARATAADPALLEKVQSVPPGRHHPTLLFAAVHDLVLGGVDHPVAARFAHPMADEGATADFFAACDDLWPEIADRLEHRSTQTNEANRAAVLRPAINEAVGDRPVALVDVGASAGLNLMLDRYAYDYEPGARSFGDRRSAVRLRCAIEEGAPPVDHDVVVASRVGIDTEPVDLDDPREEQWLRACLWPGQDDRVQRLSAALRMIRLDRPAMIEGDVLDVLPDALSAIDDGLTPVVMTTWVLAYLPEESRRAFVDVLRESARSRLVAWVSLEAPGVAPLVPDRAAPEGTADSIVGRVRFRNGDVDATVLGVSHPHGNWLRWLA